MAGSDRAIGTLRLFTLDRPDWTVEQVAAALKVSLSSAYRYVATLEGAGLLTTVSSGSYTLGPAFIQCDRQIQLTDPLLRAARPIMAEILRFAPQASRVVLCRRFRDTVLCVHQISNGEGLSGVSYERGKPMPVFLGATSKVILAHQSQRDLQRLFRKHQAEIHAARLGKTWAEFSEILAGIRKAGYFIAHAEVDPERVGIAAPILDSNRRILGSLSYVVSMAEKSLAPRLGAIAISGARDIEKSMYPAVTIGEQVRRPRESPSPFAKTTSVG